MRSEKMSQKAKGLIGLALMIVLGAVCVFGTDYIDKMFIQKEAAKPSVGLNDGTYTQESPEYHNGYKGAVTMTVSGGKITALTYDCTDESGATKSQLSMDGQYVMTENGPKWHEQAQALADYVIANQSVDGITMNEEGKTDAVASVSISVGEFVNLVKDCLSKASGAGSEAAYKDGTYTAQDSEFTDGYKGIVTMTVSGGAVTALSYDCVDESGATKSQLSMDGKYVMTENGPKWHEQSKALADYVIANQSVDGITMDEAGKTDAVASVSISVGGFINLVEDCFRQAQQ